VGATGYSIVMKKKDYGSATQSNGKPQLWTEDAMNPNIAPEFGVMKFSLFF
jgi:hypothetical protein